MGYSPVAIRDVRERAIARLSDLFAQDHLDVDEFERRVSLAHRAESVAEIEKLTEDQPAAAPSTAMVLAPPVPAIVPAGQVVDRQTIFHIMGGSQRVGHWTCPRHLRTITVMGGVELDFREARLPAGVTTLSCYSLMGGITIIVPPSLAVEVSGSAIMGGFDHLHRSHDAPDPDRAVLQVRGFVVMGGVHVETRLVGETSGDANRRRRRERKEQRKLLKGRE